MRAVVKRGRRTSRSPLVPNSKFHPKFLPKSSRSRQKGGVSEGVSKTSRTGCEQDLERTSEKDLKVSLRSPENDVKDVPNEGSASDFNGAEKNVEKRRKNFYGSVVKIQQSERSDVNDRGKMPVLSASSFWGGALREATSCRGSV